MEIKLYFGKQITFTKAQNLFLNIEIFNTVSFDDKIS
jgi:hypothetical protein